MNRVPAEDDRELKARLWPWYWRVAVALGVIYLGSGIAALTIKTDLVEVSHEVGYTQRALNSAR